MPEEEESKPSRTKLPSTTATIRETYKAEKKEKKSDEGEK